MKNEAINIEEWIAYHHALGVDRFYLYDNGSTDSTIYRIRHLIEAGLVVVTDWPRKPGQVEAYDDFARHRRGDVEWAAFIDVDEFINPFGCDSIPAWLSEFSTDAAILLQWANFGPDGHEIPPAGLMIEAYRQRLPETDPVNGHVKTILRMEAYERSTGPHTFAVRGTTVDENGNAPILGETHGYAIQPVLTHRTIVVNHYYTRSRQEWIDKVTRGEADSPADQPLRRDIAWFHHYEVYATVVDERILRFAPATRIMLERFEALKR